jgi:alpha-beta hydrolase superfamily lysophospholipase
LSFAGVAAAAPASDLPALLEQVQHAPVGRIMSSYVLRAYGETYPDVRFEDYAHGLAGWLARDMARRCLAGLPALASAAEALLAGGTIFSGSPTAGALGRRLKENIPDGLLAMPVFIGQGGADELVLPAVQSRFVKAQCARGQSLRYAVYDGRDHVSVVAPDSPLVPDLVAWTADRFAGKPAAAGCTFDAK